MVTMIFGDPYKFAIITETVEAWSPDKTFCCGILLYSINGDIFPKETDNATLGFESTSFKDRINMLVVDHELYNMPKEKAFFSIFHLSFPEDGDFDYRYNFSPDSICNGHFKVFVVGNGEDVRILFSHLVYNRDGFKYELDNAVIGDTKISVEEFREIIDQFNRYVDDFYGL